MGKLFDYLEKNVDKVLHFVASIVLMIVGSVLCVKLFGHDYRTAAAGGLLFGMSVGWLKEVWDSYRGHGFGFWDLMADFAGCGVGLVLWFLVNS